METCTYFACGASKEPIISVSLLSGVLWDELKCEFNLLGAKVNFRRGISRCAPWGVYGTLPLRDVSVGPKPQPQISVWQTAVCDVEELIQPPRLPSRLRPAAGVWPEALLITLLCNPEAQGYELCWGAPTHAHTYLLYPRCPSKRPIRQVE